MRQTSASVSGGKAEERLTQRQLTAAAGNSEVTVVNVVIGMNSWHRIGVAFKREAGSFKPAVEREAVWRAGGHLAAPRIPFAS
jgi:hypothetical protein